MRVEEFNSLLDNRLSNQQRYKMLEENSKLGPVDVHRFLPPTIKGFHSFFQVHMEHLQKLSHKTNGRKLQSIVIPIIFSTCLEQKDYIYVYIGVCVYKVFEKKIYPFNNGENEIIVIIKYL